jgi:hypothetical protein
MPRATAKRSPPKGSSQNAACNSEIPSFTFPPQSNSEIPTWGLLRERPTGCCWPSFPTLKLLVFLAFLPAFWPSLSSFLPAFPDWAAIALSFALIASSLSLIGLILLP